MRSTSLGEFFFFLFGIFCDSILSVAQASLKIVELHLPCIGITGVFRVCFQVILIPAYLTSLAHFPAWF